MTTEPVQVTVRKCRHATWTQEDDKDQKALWTAMNKRTEAKNAADQRSP